MRTVTQRKPRAQRAPATSPTPPPRDHAPDPMWTDRSREAIGFASSDADTGRLADLPLSDLLLAGLTEAVTDDPVADVLRSLADELELFAWGFRRTHEEEAPQAPIVCALRALAQRVRVASALHARVAEALVTKAGSVVGPLRGAED